MRRAAELGDKSPTSDTCHITRSNMIHYYYKNIDFKSFKSRGLVSLLFSTPLGGR